MFVLAKNGKDADDANKLCRTSDQQLCVWNAEENALAYADKHKHDNWRVRPATSEDFAIVGRMKANRRNRTRPCYKVIDEVKEVTKKKTTSTNALVELFEDYELRKFAISSRAKDEKEFLVELSQVMANSQSDDWNIRLRETLPLIVDLCCKYRGYKADTVVERRELVAGDLEIPKPA